MLRAELVSEIEHIAGNNIEVGIGWIVDGMLRSRFQWARDEGGAHALCACRLQIVGMGGDQHNLLCWQVQQLDSHLVDRWIGLVGSDQLSREDAVPGQAAILRHVRQERDVAIGERGEHKLLAQSV